jgi:hypothetical protein
MGAEIFLPHLKPKGNQTNISPKATTNGFTIVGNARNLLMSSEVAS